MTEPWEQTAALSANRVEALGIEFLSATISN